MHLKSASVDLLKLSLAYTGAGVVSDLEKHMTVLASMHHSLIRFADVLPAAPQGYIYVEAHKESHVKEAIRGLTCLLYGKGATLVPMKEMVDAITVKSVAKGSNIGATPVPLPLDIKSIL